MKDSLSRDRLLRAGWIVLGLGSVCVGGVGVVVPGLPTAVFFVFAAWCFSKSSPRLESWVMGLSGVGQLVNDYRSGLGMPIRVKFVANASMVLSVGLSAWVVDKTWVAIAILAIGAVGVVWVSFIVPTREREIERRVLELEL